MAAIFRACGVLTWARVRERIRVFKFWPCRRTPAAFFVFATEFDPRTAPHDPGPRMF